jgi:hypothetical protein
MIKIISDRIYEAVVTLFCVTSRNVVYNLDVCLSIYPQFYLTNYSTDFVLDSNSIFL